MKRRFTQQEINAMRQMRVESRATLAEIGAHFGGANRTMISRLINHGYPTRSDSARLTEAQVLEIFHSTDDHRVLANRYPVSAQTIQRIRKGQTYTHLTGGNHGRT